MLLNLLNPYSSSPFTTSKGSRIVNLACLASPLAALVPLAYITGPDSKMTNFAWDYAIWSVEKAGPTFIKLVQWASTRNDIFPHNFISKFSKLQDDTMGTIYFYYVSFPPFCCSFPLHVFISN